MDIDPGIFERTNEAVWTITPKGNSANIEIDEGFMLLGPQSGAFGDWMIDYLPRYVAADISGTLPPVPVLVDQSLPDVHRQSLKFMLSKPVELVEIPAFTTARVRRLWCAATLHYAPTREKMDGRFKFDYVVPPPERIARVTREMARRVRRWAPSHAGPERVFLARRPSRWRKLLNHAEIEAAARARGFSIVTPEDMDFIGQATLLRHARFVVAPEGSSLFLAYFAQPESKLCILNHRLVEWPTVYGSYLSGVGIEITILTGPIVRPHPEFPHRADYTINERQFCDFLDHWLADA